MTRQPNINSKLKNIVFKAKTLEDEQKVDDFKTLCIQDGIQIYQLMSEAIDLVFKVHRWPPGNPQLTLATCLEVKVLSLGKCGFANCTLKAVAAGIYLPKNQEYKLCMKHLRHAQNNPENWRFRQ
jgi:hypothetical protein